MAPAAQEVDEAPEDDLANCPDIFYVGKKLLEECKAKVKEGKVVEKALLEKLANAESLDDDEVMVPIDMRGAGEDLDDDLEEMVGRLEPKRAAEIFVKCAEYFDANKDNEPEEDRPQEITAGEWKRLQDLDEEAEEEDFLEDAEEEEAEEELEEGEDEANADEPAKKKAKKS